MCTLGHVSGSPQSPAMCFCELTCKRKKINFLLVQVTARSEMYIGRRYYSRSDNGLNLNLAFDGAKWSLIATLLCIENGILSLLIKKRVFIVLWGS